MINVHIISMTSQMTCQANLNKIHNALLQALNGNTDLNEFELLLKSCKILAKEIGVILEKQGD